ncbi:MAG: NfeD family protein [Zavarzinia sp.]|nr:NfeD family protein [Zavarzinia sp.]
MDGFDIVFWYWYALAVALIVLEILAPGVIFLWLAVGCAATGTLMLVVPDLAVTYQFVVFAIGSALSLLLGRGLLRDWLTSPAVAGLNQREKALIGREAVLIQAIAGGTGRVRLDDTSWTVTGPDLPEGTRVRVVDAEGTRLTVEAL